MTKETKIMYFLCNNVLINSICRYIVKRYYNDIIESFREIGKQDFKLEDNTKFDIDHFINIEYLIQILFPFVFTDDKLAKIVSDFKMLNNQKEKMEFFLNINNLASEKINREYKNDREFWNEIENSIENACFTKLLSPLAHRYLKIYSQTVNLELINNIVIELQEEYKSWKYNKSQYKSVYPNIIIYFWISFLFIDKKLLYYFFDKLNLPLPHSFDHNQIDYIREMAPKLRIASYLNEEYANYKKLYNPVARDFYFGVDNPEESELLLENNPMVEEVDIEEEKKEKRYLDRLSHFTKPKLIKLLEKFRDRKEPFVHKETKNKNWLFVFGMNGDTPPKGFEKIKWEAKYNGRPAKGALIDFLELLGYDINQLYEVDSIKILNECFECYNPDNKLVPIDQNDFHYKKKTKEREHSKMFYNIFKEIIEGIEKQP